MSISATRARQDRRTIAPRSRIARHPAPSIVRQARHDAGRSPDAARAGRALAQAAVDHRQTLTPHDVTIERAGNAATKLDRYMESLRGSGVLAEFNRQYKRRRIEAAARLHDLQNCDIEVEAGAAECAFQNYSASLYGGSPSTLPITKPRGIPLISHPPDRACILDCRFRRPCLLDAWDLCRSVR